jgi:catechol 2,3-dioxygenase-like lactoylglutathione lyase family enzyme
MLLNRITRRDALFVLGAAALPQANAEGGLLRATRVDHVALAVGDIDKAMMFYRRLFGNEVLKDSRTPRRYLRLGPCYMAIAPAAAGEARRVDHFSIGIENFDAPGMKSTLEKAGLKVRESNVGLFVTDPDGTSVQIWADQSWKQLSNAAPEAGPKQEALFHSRGMHHVAIQANDMARAAEFYRKLFGEPTRPSWPARPESWSTTPRPVSRRRSITSACWSITSTPLRP